MGVGQRRDFSHQLLTLVDQGVGGFASRLGLQYFPVQAGDFSEICVDRLDRRHDQFPQMIAGLAIQARHLVKIFGEVLAVCDQSGPGRTVERVVSDNFPAVQEAADVFRQTLVLGMRIVCVEFRQGKTGRLPESHPRFLADHLGIQERIDDTPYSGSPNAITDHTGPPVVRKALIELDILNGIARRVDIRNILAGGGQTRFIGLDPRFSDVQDAKDARHVYLRVDTMDGDHCQKILFPPDVPGR